jgi:ADP-ribose pyrophosphatase
MALFIRTVAKNSLNFSTAPIVLLTAQKLPRTKPSKEIKGLSAGRYVSAGSDGTELEELVWKRRARYCFSRLFGGEGRMTNWPRLIARRVVPVSQWMTIVSRDVQFSQGAVAETYYAIEQPDYVAAVAITPEGRILLVRQYRPAIERFSLELPAGMIDENEDPANAMARELFEETGYKTDAITLIGKAATCASRINNSIYSFFIQVGVRVSTFVEEPGVSVSLATPAELRDMIRSGEFSEQAHLGVLALAVANGSLIL